MERRDDGEWRDRIPAVSCLNNAIDMTRFRGHRIDLFVGRGLITRPYTVKGSPDAIKAFNANLRVTRR